MKKIQCVFLMVLSIFLIGNAQASDEDIVKCQARVANHLYEIMLDRGTHWLEVKTDSGAYYKGVATYYHSPYNGEDVYYLPTGFSSAYELAFELKGKKRIAFCLKPSECYLCRPY